MKYIEQLPRGIAQEKLRCQALDSNGERCRKRAIYEISYHGDPEGVFDEPTQWVAVAVCDYHLNWCEQRFLKKALGGKPPRRSG